MNQALEVLLPEPRDVDLVLVMDAASQLDPGFGTAAVLRVSALRAVLAGRADGVLPPSPGVSTRRC